MGARVVVVGGGIAGLAAAYALGRDAPAGTAVTVLEAAAAVGGKLRVGPVAGMPVDAGAESMLARAPEGMELARAVGLGDRLVAPATNAASVAAGGILHPLPAGTVLGVPADLPALRASGLLSAAGLAAVADGLAGPADPVGPDVPVGEYAAGRLGREVVDRLVDPVLGGVYAGRADLLSLRATMPALADALDRAPGNGSLLAAVGAVRAQQARLEGPVFLGLRGGLGELPAAVARASGAHVRVGATVRRVDRTPVGFRLTLGPVPRPEYLEADAVVLAAPAAKAAGMLTGLAPAAAAELAGIEYASIALVTLAYPAAAGAVLGPARSGLLVPAAERRAVKAVTFFAAKWPHLRPAGGPVVVRASVGRYGEERLLHCSDGELVDLVRTELAELVGLAGAPVETRVSRWGGALPQYAVGHLDRVRRISAAVDAVPGLAVCGAAYGGVGIPACIRSGYAAAARVVDHLLGRGRIEAWSTESRPVN